MKFISNEEFARTMEWHIKEGRKPHVVNKGSVTVVDFAGSRYTFYKTAKGYDMLISPIPNVESNFFDEEEF